MVSIARSLLAVTLLVAFTDAKCPFNNVHEDTWSESTDPASGCPMLAQNGPSLTPSKHKTKMGCTCKSGCGATITQGLAACDWCRTEDSCGKFSLGGHWDYCVYNSVPEFEVQTSEEKMAQIWARATDSSVVGKSGRIWSFAAMLKPAATESMITTFDDRTELMPAGRDKVVHAQGVLCPFELQVESDSKFTGIFSPGSVKGIMRMGSAVPVDTPGIGLFPGIGFKFLRSGVRSRLLLPLGPEACVAAGSLGQFRGTPDCCQGNRWILRLRTFEPQRGSRCAAHQVSAGDWLRLHGRAIRRLCLHARRRQSGLA